MDSLARQSIELHLKITGFRGEDLDVIELGFEIVDLAGSAQRPFRFLVIRRLEVREIPAPSQGRVPPGPPQSLSRGFFSLVELRTTGARRTCVLSVQ